MQGKGGVGSQYGKQVKMYIQQPIKIPNRSDTVLCLGTEKGRRRFTGVDNT